MSPGNYVYVLLNCFLNFVVVEKVISLPGLCSLCIYVRYQSHMPVVSVDGRISQYRILTQGGLYPENNCWS